jgi:hypothetical protein
VPAFGLVDAVVGLLILAAVSLSLAQAFLTMSSWDIQESARIDKLVSALDAESHAKWY